MFWISFITYCIPTIMAFLVEGYDINDEILVYATITGMVGATLGRVASGFLTRLPHPPLIILQLAVGMVFFLGPPLKWADWLAWLTVALNFVFTFQYGLQSTLLFKTASMHIDSRFAHNLCRWLGVVEQAGAFISSIFTFVLVFAGVFDRL